VPSRISAITRFVMRLWRFSLPLLMLALLMGPSRVGACNIPVFRYALERWRTNSDEDRYQAIVFHRGPLAAEDEKVVAALRPSAEGQGAPANLTVETVDLAGQAPQALGKLRQEQKKVQLPRMVLRYPDRDDGRQTIWSGPLKADLVRALLDSPARRDIARRLMKGDSVVWILLESGDKEKDDAAAAVLQTQLRRLEKSLQLPDPAGDNSVQLLSNLPLRLVFSTVRVKRTDPAETMLIQMLLHTEADLAEFTEPMVFPVFGRGRALDGLIGKGINADNIENAARFLCGACSCLIKRLNPGVDLLIAADWDAVIEDRDSVQPPRPSLKGERVPIPTPKQPTDAESSAIDRTPLQDREPERPAISGPLLSSAIAVAAVFVVGAGILAWRARRGKKEEGGA
jgi:hypothetical protein